MADPSLVPLPDPGTLRIGPAPHWRELPGLVPMTLAFTLAAVVALLPAALLFGWAAIRVLAISTGVALLVESMFNAMRGRTRSWSESHALLIGVLFACTLPPNTTWRAPVIGTLIAVVVGELLAGGVGNYLWHPVALARVAVQFLFHDELTPERWPILAPGRLLWGSLERARDLPSLWHWGTHPPPVGVEAWSAVRPADPLRDVVPALPGDPASGLAALVRDAMPPWRDTLIGVAGGAIGEACVLALVVAGFILLWRGFLRWPMLMGALVAAAIAAAVLPVRVRMPDDTLGSCPLPGVVTWEGLPVGLAYVSYHLTAGALPFVIALLAPDPSSSPLTSRGHLLFGIIIGFVTVFMRVSLGLPAAEYWALLLANTSVPLIDRLTRRRVFGT